MKLSLLENVYSSQLLDGYYFLRWYKKPRKEGQNELVLVCNQGSLVGLCMQDYKSLCAAVTICATLVNIQTHRQTTI